MKPDHPAEKDHSGRIGVILALLCLGLLLLIFFLSTIGTARIPFANSVRIILSNLPGLKERISLETVKKSHVVIIESIRLPRIILAILVGMGLSVSGVVFQGIFKNPMAEPYVLGVSSGAALGAAVAMVLSSGRPWFGQWTLSGSAFLGAILATVTVYMISGSIRRRTSTTLLLSGIALSFLLSSMISLIMVFNRDQVENIVFWTMGSFTAASWDKVAITAPFIVIGSGILLFFARDLNILALGDDTATTLGLRVESLRRTLLLIATLIAAASVAVSGIIGFVGLIIPHAVRLVAGANHRRVLPLSFVAGGVFMVLADTLARTAVPSSEIPIGVITSLTGVPFFLLLLKQGYK